MNSQIGTHRALDQVLRWVARIWSIASLGLILLFIIGEGINPATAKEWFGLLFFPFGIAIGMVLSWRREFIGGSITVGSLLVFYVIHLATTGVLPKGWAWLAFAAPGFLFLLSACLSQKRPSQQ